MNLLIRNGILITDSLERKCDIYIENGIFSKISALLPETLSADEEIDASGKYIFPGGIDPHVHMNLPTPAGFSSDNFYTGSRAALSGGTTTLIDFVTPKRGQPIPEALTLRKKEAEEALTDYMFHISPVEFTQNTEKELIKCLDMGIRSFKVYMAYKSSIGLKDEELEHVLQVVGKHNGIVAVHCEMGDKIEALRNQFYQQGNTGHLYHALSRPPESEWEAVSKVLGMARKAHCTLYLVHISTASALEFIDKAKKSGQNVFAETCPQYLLFDESEYKGNYSEASPYIISPPLRTNADKEALWKALANGVLQSVGSDHCPFSMAQKEAGKFDFRKTPNGAGGVEHRMSLLFTYGVLENRITLQQFVNITSVMPAKIFGLYPKKGCVAEGADADLVIWNKDVRNTIKATTHHQHCDTNIYEGITTEGKPEYVIRNGYVVVRNGEISTKRPGNFLSVQAAS